MNKSSSYLVGVIITIIIFTATFCTSEDQKNAGHGAIAKAYNEYLYQDDLTFKEDNLNKADSLNEVQAAMNKWFKSKLVANQAKTQLSKETLNEINRKINDYQQELLEFEYNRQIIKQKMDTTIADSLIQTYYNKYISNYLLDEPYLRFIYVKCDKKAYVKEVEDWIKDSIDIHNLEDFCKEELQECHLYEDKWIALRKFQSKLNGIDLDINKIKSGDEYIKIKNDKVHYLIRILEFKDKGNPAPLSFVRSDIHSILVNKRKSEFINAFINDLLTSEMDKGNIKVLE